MKELSTYEDKFEAWLTNDPPKETTQAVKSTKRASSIADRMYKVPASAANKAIDVLEED